MWWEHERYNAPDVLKLPTPVVWVSMTTGRRATRPDVLKLPTPLVWVSVTTGRRATRPDDTGWEMINPLWQPAGDLVCPVSLTVTCFVCCQETVACSVFVCLYPTPTPPPPPPASFPFSSFLWWWGVGGWGWGVISDTWNGSMYRSCTFFWIRSAADRHHG